MEIQYKKTLETTDPFKRKIKQLLNRVSFWQLTDLDVVINDIGSFSSFLIQKKCQGSHFEFGQCKTTHKYNYNISFFNFQIERHSGFNLQTYKEKRGDTKWVMRIRPSKKDQTMSRTKNDLQHTTQKTKDWAPRTPLKLGVN